MKFLLIAAWLSSSGYQTQTESFNTPQECNSRLNELVIAQQFGAIQLYKAGCSAVYEI